MKTNEELKLVATRFIQVVEEYLEKGKKDFGMNIEMALPLSQTDFDTTIEAMSIIQEMGKERRIKIRIEDEDEAIGEYGHTRVINFRRI